MRAVVTSIGALALLFVTFSANAQNLNRVEVNVPFAFAAAGRVLAPGEYRVSISETNQVVTLTGEDSTVLFLMSAPGDQVQGQSSVLRFYGRGNYRILHEVVIAGAVRRITSANAKGILIASRRHEGPAIGETTTQLLGINPSSQGKDN